MVLSHDVSRRHTLLGVVTIRSFALAFALCLLALFGAAPAYAQLEQEPADEPLPGAVPEEAGDEETSEPAEPETEPADEEPADEEPADGDLVPPDETEPALPTDPTQDPLPLARDSQDYEPDQRGEHDGPEPRPEPDEAAPPPMAPDSEDEARGDITTVSESMPGVARTAADGSSFFGFDVQLWLGGGLTSVEAFENQNLVRPDQQGGFGANLGLSAGLRMGPITVGPRATLTVDPSFLLITVGADVRVILTSDAVAPTLRASLSGVFLTGLSDALPSQSGAGGVHAELGAGVRWHFGGGFTFGAEVSGGYLHLDRQEEAGCTAPCTEGEFDLRRSGSSDGLTLRLNLSAGYRF